MERYTMRAKIAAHLDLSDTLETAAKEVLENELSEENAAIKHRVNHLKLRKKVINMKYKNKFYKEKPKIEAAVREVLEERLPNSFAANDYGISRQKLWRETEKARAIGLKDYKYDRKINYSSLSFNGLTYEDEKSLLNDLIKWCKDELGKICTCQICALEKLSTLVFEYVESRGILRPPFWNKYKRADNNWLKDFEMRYTDDMYIWFEPCCWMDEIN